MQIPMHRTYSVEEPKRVRTGSSLVTKRTPVPPMKAPVEEGLRSVRSRKPSQWIWVTYVWLILASTRPLSSWLSLSQMRGPVEDLDVSGSPIDRNLMILLIVLALFVIGSRANRAKEILRCNRWLCVLFVMMFLSVVWSNFPGISFRRCFRSVGTLPVVLVVLTEDDPLEAISVLLRRVYYLIIPLSVVAIKYFRNIGVGYTWDGTEEMWVGLTKDKNNLGQIAVICAIVCVWHILRNWPKKKRSIDWLAFIPALWLLRGSATAHSGTAIVGFVIGAAGLFGLQLVKRRAAHAKRIILMATIGFLVLAPTIDLALALFDTTPANILFETTGRNATFSDRTFLWKDLLDIAAKRPVLGVGFGAFWVGPAGYDLYPMPNWSSVTHTWRPGEGHNGFIDVYVELGVVGLALTFFVICSAFTGALRDLQSEFEFGRLRLIIVLSILVNNLTESSLLDGTHSYWCLFLLVAVNIPARYLSPLKSETVRHNSSTQHEFYESAGMTVGVSRLPAAGRIR